MGQGKRRAEAFKLGAVSLDQKPDQTFTGVSNNLSISDSSRHRWVRVWLPIPAMRRPASPQSGRK